MNNMYYLNEPLPSVKEKLISYVNKEYDDDYTDIIGFIQLPYDGIPNDITEAALDSINFGKKVKNVVVLFRTNEGWEKPHFHLDNGSNFKCAIRLDTADYFKHGPYQDTLNKSQKKIFDDFIGSNAKGNNVSRWEAAVIIYNLQYGSSHPLKVKEKPNYNELP